MTKPLNDPCFSHGLMSMEDALELMLNVCGNDAAVEDCKVTDALDRVIAEDVFSPIDVPPADNSAMDGFAFRYQDKEHSESLEIVGESLAGHPYSGTIHHGQCIRIMTGAVLPADADTVLMQEKIDISENHIAIRDWPEKGNSIRRKGEDIQNGARIIAKGTRLSPVDLGLLASIGLVSIKVFCKLKVAVLCSGDELSRAGDTKPANGIFESNSVVVSAMLNRIDCKVRDMGIVRDDPVLIKQAFEESYQWADLLITSGGVSVGQADYIKDVLNELGEIGFWKLAIKPGKPFAFGMIKNKPFFGLPGNPVSATITMHQLVIPVLRQLQGEFNNQSFSFNLPLSHELKRKKGRRDFQRATICADQGVAKKVILKSRQGSGILSSMNQSDGYAIIEPECTTLSEGESVRFQPFDAVIGRI